METKENLENMQGCVKRTKEGNEERNGDEREEMQIVCKKIEEKRQKWKEARYKDKRKKKVADK